MLEKTLWEDVRFVRYCFIYAFGSLVGGLCHGPAVMRWDRGSDPAGDVDGGGGEGATRGSAHTALWTSYVAQVT